MAKLSTENLVRVLDALVATPHWRKAMAAGCRASEYLAFSWRAKSIAAMKDNDTSSIFFLEWRGAFDWWHCHAGRARTENVILYEAAIRDQALNGIEVPVLGPDQRPVFKEDPDLIDVNDDDLWTFYGRRNRYLLDAKGHPIPLTKIEQLPAPLRLAVLRQDKRYIEQTQHDVRLEVTETAKPFQRLPGEERPDVERLRKLAAMPASERRLLSGASEKPMDAKGRAMRANTGTVPTEIEAPHAPARPSYARPVQSLDNAGTGKLEPPPGGFRVR